MAVEPPGPVLSNSTNSSFDGPARKSHDKTISGLFTYTNGGEADTGRSEHRIDQFKNFRNPSHTSLTNGIPNGSLKSRERSHSKAASTHSMSSARNSESHPRQIASSDGLTKLSNVEYASEPTVNGDIRDGQTDDSNKAKPDVPPIRTHDVESHHQATASTMPDTAWSDGNMLSPTTSKHVQPLQRFSSPPNMSAGASIQDREKNSSELPRLTHRHTLGIPKAPAAPGRGSRDFSFSGGPSEEALTTARFSPTREQFESQARHRRASLGLVRRTTRSVVSDAHQEELPPDEDAARWTEIVKQKRASRRKRREEEDDDRVIVGKKVEEGHVNWVTAYNMLTGIRFTVSRTNAKMDRDLTEADFDAKHKLSFDVTGNELTPSAKYDFKFKDYAPWVFRRLRAIFGLDPADYLMSLTSKYILSELGSPGKSGSFFYFSRDYKYIIKTIHHAEHKLLRKILREYYNHVVENPNTLLSQIYGLHRVKIPYGRKIHFMVMNNLFPPHRDIHQTFDLKGSTVGRDFKENELSENPRATLKDLNWLRRDYHLEFDPNVKQIFVDQLKRDVGLLQRLHIMDYSLLVGIHDLDKGNEENLRETTLKVFQPGGDREDDMPSMLTRTPSRLENAKKARALRLTLKKERPMPINLMNTKMPDAMSSGDERHDRLFYRDDGGVRATHEDGTPGELIYYLGVIDCLTHYGLVKRLEHFWKGLHDNRSQISPVPPQAYGDRFINFITGITMTKEEAERRQTHESTRSEPVSTAITRSRGNSGNQHLGIGTTINTSMDGTHSLEREKSPPGSPIAVERTMQKAQKQVNKETNPEKGRRRSEEEKPQRTLLTTDDQDRTLPVVSEEMSLTDEKSGGEGRLDIDEVKERLSESKRPEGIRMVSASTKRDSNEEQNRAEEMDGDAVGTRKERDRPPRLDSSLLPSVSPIDEKGARGSMDGDPEKR